ncbi:Acetophenone carboxylase alpha subunit [Fundidesulfovibrio magnetotacticus]|uniref:Acetophenone carboxylase alpha subunit n=1 Tax=Fundidesulfovibrio magnetotacticus TaxID=2730080 RepID=A0A6V8LTE7_9BACT|nr:hydantoinase/oxoprolinase family protein [Fundidesulfovibrio magnetotacticus]GFK93086.1 Acetophenone carboxylase alpha subunit [Fundidesulfovibrio magnetotacticus]
MLMGIDVGGTHTDAVLVCRKGLLAWAKAKTHHGDLMRSIREVLTAIAAKAGAKAISRLNLSTTLSTNAIVEGLTEPVGVFVSAGPGIDARAYAVGEHYAVIPGCTDHRGRVTRPLDEARAREHAARCKAAHVSVYACVSKFSPRNPEFEESLRAVVHPQADFVSCGHEFSGQLGFPRRIHTAACNASVWRVFNRFADAVQRAALDFGLMGQVNILKADGGTMPLSVSRSFPVESILSGPAASVMGIIAVCDIAEDSVILDIGGTTTDIALFAEGAPLIEPDGAVISGRPTLVRALKTRSIGVGGDSALSVLEGQVRVGPRRLGPSMAEGGERPTLTDALNVLGRAELGDVSASRRGVNELARANGMDGETLAQDAALAAVTSIRAAVIELTRAVNDRPVYTIYELLEGKRVAPSRVYVMGGPAKALEGLLSEVFPEEVVVPEGYAVANAIGAALSRPTLSAELFADTQRGRMLIPGLDVEQDVPRTYSLDEAQADAAQRLGDYLNQLGVADPEALVETLEAQSFNMVEDGELVGRSIRVKCQVKPGVLPGYREAVRQPC